VDGNFNTPTGGLTPPNYPTTITGLYSSGPASASGWDLWNNAPVTTSSQLLPSTDPGGSGFMEDINSPGISDGLYQYFPMQSAASATIDVYVLSGTVTFDLFTDNGHTELAHIKSTKLDTWQTLTIPLTSGNPDELVLYTGTQGGGEFYADDATISSVPDEGTMLVSGALLLPILFGRFRSNFVGSSKK
jgi:hypothetical protein